MVPNGGSDGSVFISEGPFLGSEGKSFIVSTFCPYKGKVLNVFYSVPDLLKHV